MKKSLLILLITFAFMTGYSQMLVDGGSVVVQTGATLVIDGDLTMASSGDIQIDGDVELKGDFINNTGTVNAASTGTLAMNGTAAQEIKGSASTTFGSTLTLEIDNTTGVSLTSMDETVNGTLAFTSGLLTLGTYNLTVGSTDPTGAAAGQYVQTNSTGELKRSVPADGATNVPFDVGNSAFNPLVLQNSGTATTDTYGVIAQDGLPGSFTGTDHAVNRHWDVTEDTPGGSDLTTTAQWIGSEELTNFDRTDCSVGLTVDAGATVAWTASGAASGTSPYTRSGAGFTGVGTFMVGDYFYEGLDLDLDLFLAGPYSAGSMSNAIYLNGDIPLTDPYGTATTVATIPTTAIDWIKVELRDKTNSSNVQKTYAFFVDNSGNVLNTDGNVGAKLTGMLANQYFVTVNHRNHLGAMTNATVDLSGGSGVFDFTSPASVVYGTDAMYNNVGTMVMWAGDTDGNNNVEFVTGTSDITPISNKVLTDPGNTSFLTNYIVASVYDLADADMNGNVEFVTGSSDITPISFSVLNNPGNPTALTNVILSQQIP